MQKIKEYLETLSESVTITKKEKLMTVAIAALSGMVLGMLLSPRKTTSICCGNDNGNYYPSDEDHFDDEEFDADDEEELRFN